MIFLALLPFLLFTGLLFFSKLKLLWASLITFSVTALMVLLVWQMNVGMMASSMQKGVMTAVDILIIIFGAVFFLETLQGAHIIRRLCVYLETFSKDYRVQVLLLAWFLENFLEGTSGFGTPLTVVAPLLVGIGLAPIQALIVTLLGNSASGLFGAVGTPIRTGFAGLTVEQVPTFAAAINVVGFLVPVFMLWTVTRSREQGKKEFVEALPFAVVAGLAYVLPSFLFSFFGQEFPTILGAIVGLAIMVVFIKLNFLVPAVTRKLQEEHFVHDTMPLYKVFVPYGILIATMVVGKFFIKSFNPGFAFLIASVPVILLWSNKTVSLRALFVTSLKRSWEPFVVIASISAMVQLMINSGNNAAGLPSVLDYMTKNLAYAFLPFITPIIGAFGSFITGSTTISNVMFGSLLARAAEAAGIGTVLVLSLQLVGAAAGNMISIADVLPAQAVVGLSGKERTVIKSVLIPCGLYVGLVGIIGLLLHFARL